MAAVKKPCGTETAYQRHYRNGEKPCDACLEAHRAKKREADEARRRESADMVREVVAEAPLEEDIDPLAEALDNLRIVKAVLRHEGTPANTVAALSKRRDELVDRVKRLQEECGPAEVSAIDELTNRRARRAAATG